MIIALIIAPVEVLSTVYVFSLTPNSGWMFHVILLVIIGIVAVIGLSVYWIIIYFIYRNTNFDELYLNTAVAQSEKYNIFGNTKIFIAMFLSAYLLYLICWRAIPLELTLFSYPVYLLVPYFMAPVFITIAWMRGANYKKPYLSVLPILATIPSAPYSLLMLTTLIWGSVGLPEKEKKHKPLDNAGGIT